MQPPPAPQQSPQHRVKLYCLKEDGTWDDKGVGHVLLDDSAANGTRKILVISETSAATPMLVSRILLTNNYQRQGKNISPHPTRPPLPSFVTETLLLTRTTALPILNVAFFFFSASLAGSLARAPFRRRDDYHLE